MQNYDLSQILGVKKLVGDKPCLLADRFQKSNHKFQITQKVNSKKQIPNKFYKFLIFTFCSFGGEAFPLTYLFPFK